MKKLSILGLSTILAACGGGGGGGSPSVTAPVASVNLVAVSPSLGKFSSGANVTIKKPNGDTIKTALTEGSGMASVDVGSYSGPLVVEVTGGTNVTYFDEGTGSAKAFTAADKLRAISPNVRSAVGVTAATNAAVALLESSSSTALQSATETSINKANSQIEVMLGIADALLPPKLVDASSAGTLNIANLADRYALQLAALAKIAKTGKSALDVAKDLASDASDGKIDGKLGTGFLTDQAFVPATFVADLQNQIRAAANQFADATSKAAIIADLETVIGKINTDVTAITLPSNASDVKLAKAFFSEMRTTLRSFSNGSNAFLDNQANRASGDIKTYVGPEGAKLTNRISTISEAVGIYQNARNYSSANPLGFFIGTDPTDSTKPALVSISGSLNAAWFGYGFYQHCWTDSVTPANISKVNCYRLTEESAQRGRNRFSFVVFEVKPNASVDQYTYIATRYNRAVSFSNSSVQWGNSSLQKANNTYLTTDAASPVYLAQGAGTFTSSKDATGNSTSVTLIGTLPASTSTCIAPQANSVTQSTSDCPSGQVSVPATDVDSVSISASRSALAGVVNGFRYALAGNVSTKQLVIDKQTLDAARTVSLALETGSAVDTVETSTSQSPYAVNFIGSFATSATKVVGSFAFDTFKADADNVVEPTRIVFNGSITDLTNASAASFLAGKLELTQIDRNLYRSSAPITDTNFAKISTIFTGTVQAPSRPLLKLVISATASGKSSSDVTVAYTYDKISLTGGGKANNGSNNLTLSNQDGIQVAQNPATPSEVLVSRAGVKVASIRDNVIYYVDGSSESLF